MRLRWAVLVIGLWVAFGAAANVAIPQLEGVIATKSKPLAPAGAQATIAAEGISKAFGQPENDNVNNLVIERDNGPLTPEDRQFYNDALARLAADTDHVRSVLNLWTDETTTPPAALSPDGECAYAIVRLSGSLGSSEATDALSATREAVAELPRPDGLNAYVAGMGSPVPDTVSILEAGMLELIAVASVLIIILLLIVYRSFPTALVPLVSAVMALAAARPTIAFLGLHDLADVSIFAFAMMSAMILGAGTDYGMFMLGRYHEERRRNVPPGQALSTTFRHVTPVILASSVTITIACLCLNFAKVGILRSSGTACAVGIAFTLLASITLTPALIALLSRRGLLEPRKQKRRPTNTWGRIGAVVVRWPAPVTVVSMVVLISAILVLPTMQLGFSELKMQPASTESNRAFDAVARHFSMSKISPETVVLVADHDMRNPADLIAIERVARRIAEVPEVVSVQAATRPTGERLREATLTYQVGAIGDRLSVSAREIRQRLQNLSSIATVLDQLDAAVSNLAAGISSGRAGLERVGDSTKDISRNVDALGTGVAEVSGFLDPVRNFVSTTADCLNNPVCTAAQRVTGPADLLELSAANFKTAAVQIAEGTDTTSAAISNAAGSLARMRDALAELRTLSSSVQDLASGITEPVDQLVGYLHELRDAFGSSEEAGFYMPNQVFGDPKFQTVLSTFFSPDGRATLLQVYNAAPPFDAGGAARSERVQYAAASAVRDTPLSESQVLVTGADTVVRDLGLSLRADLRQIAIVTLILIFLVLLAMLRSPVAATAVLCTVVISYASAIGVSVLIWQHVLGRPLYWGVITLAFIALVAVGADYNLLFTSRMREEIQTSPNRTAILRAFRGTGGLVTGAGLVFGFTMFAMLDSDATSIAQVGSTIGIGLLIDTLLVRAFLLPGLAAWLGRWFWWPYRCGIRRTKGPLAGMVHASVGRRHEGGGESSTPQVDRFDAATP